MFKDILFNFDIRNTQFHAIYNDEFLDGYEKEVCALIDYLLPANGSFYDIGSNWGYFSFYVASNDLFKGRIVGFEPVKSSFNDMQRLCITFGLSHIMQCRNLALSEKTTTQRMMIPDGIHSGIAQIADNEKKGFEVKTVRLDEIRDLPTPDCMKIDVEGHEYEVLVGAKELISAVKPFIIMESWRDDRNIAKTLKPLMFLEQNNYSLFIPAWLNNQDGTYLYEGHSHQDSSQSASLCLILFKSNTRFLFQDRINIFACHESKLGKLQYTN